MSPSFADPVLSVSDSPEVMEKNESLNAGI